MSNLEYNSPVELPLVTKKRFRTIRSTNYDVNNTCNLTCEGCYYFVSGQKRNNKRPSFADYDQFFAQEAARGVNYPQFSGGEPSLNPEALRAAAKHWTDGIIYTNGIKKISAEVPFRIAISVWGAKKANDILRGENSYQQAFATAKGDPRALIFLTLNRQNIESIPEIVEDCVKENVPISFNDFSMTTEYMRLLEQEDVQDNVYFRFSTKDDNLSLRPQDRIRAGELIERMIDLYPKTVLYSKILNNWVHRSEPIHTIDETTNLATDCAFIHTPGHRNFGFDMQPLQGKECCAPELDCRDCRISPAANFTLLKKLAERMRRSAEARAQLEELREYMMRLHFWNWEMDTGNSNDPFSHPQAA